VKQLFANFNNVQEFNYSVHVSNEFHFVYFNNPKCACTTIKASLNLACAAALGRKLEYGSIADIHNRNHNLLLRPDQIGYTKFKDIIDDSSYFKFCFLREPVQRIASAFASKLTWQSESLARLNRSLRRSDDATLTFPEFIELLLSHKDVRDMDEHWRLQRKQICYDCVPFDRVGLFENLDADLAAVLGQIFDGDEERPIFDVRHHFPGNTSHSRIVTQTLTADMKATINRIYNDDVIMYSSQPKAATVSAAVS
jgi:Sulfotransferase family